MEQLTKEEIEFIANVLNQLTFKPGASKQVIMCENIITKISIPIADIKE